MQEVEVSDFMGYGIDAIALNTELKKQVGDLPIKAEMSPHRQSTRLSSHLTTGSRPVKSNQADVMRLIAACSCDCR